MFTPSAPSAPTVSASVVSTTSPPPRTSARLRGGLAFLRNYTHALQSAAREPSSSSPTPSSSSSASPANHSKTSPRPRAASASILPPAASPSPSSSSSAASSASSASSSSASASASAASPTGPQQPQQHPHRPHLTRTHTAPDTPAAAPTLAYPPSVSLQLPPPPSTMTRYRTDSATPQLTVRNQSGPTPAASSSSPAASSSMQPPPQHDDRGDHHLKNLPSIRFIPHTDPRAARPSLQFATITRTLPDESAIIRVGRYSERDNVQEPPAHVPSAAAVGFKSKVVSRKHCELWCKDGSWFIKDVKSSSGTFLNHIRLSQPNVESKPFRLKDGDIIQLGIDFRGGEEAIFRCVKIRIECNRGWQQALNTFNKQTHERLRNLGKAKKDGDNASMHASECSICLMSIAPCQSLFVAPCSHVWHYKCIRPILNGSTWPNFLCPNCRAVADLEADVEEMLDFETWVDDPAGSDANSNDANTRDRQVTPKSSTHLALPNGDSTSAPSSSQAAVSDLETAVSNMRVSDPANGIISIINGVPSTPQQPQPRNTSSTHAAPSSATQTVSINVQSANEASLSPLYHHTNHGPSPDRGAADCPMTPRNDAGPFVLDGSGSAGRAAGQSLVRDRDGAEATSGASTSAATGPDGAPLLPPIHVD